ncbi:hypothetical protein JKP88DRAFT_167425 [Tribonema minus]|uniref:Uncharacterized protein n=1 Tax=Tribonema minus TaxID=303371 RepID=A0A835YQF7_9STRA|nr:hypothetical protein JKP88DRAFT_167425 [Tribonema minus]
MWKDEGSKRRANSAAAAGAADGGLGARRGAGGVLATPRQQVQYVFQHRESRAVAVVNSTGDMASAKALHTLRMASAAWRELRQVPLEQALEEASACAGDAASRLRSPLAPQQQGLQAKPLPSQRAAWAIGGHLLGFAGVSGSNGSREEDDAEPEVLGPTCRICGQVVSNTALLEEHMTLCKLRAAAKQKSATYNSELQRGSALLRTEIEVGGVMVGARVRVRARLRLRKL